MFIMERNENIKPYVIGLDLGGTNSVFGIVDAREMLIKDVRPSMLRGLTPEEITSLALQGCPVPD